MSIQRTTDVTETSEKLGPTVEHAPSISATDMDEERSRRIEWIDPVAEKKLLWKLDLHVVPPVTLLFLLAFLDRVNIGNAKIQGLTTDLNMKGSDYNVALFVFFIPYILFEVPSNIILKHVAPSTWLCGIMFFWGICTIGQGLIKTYPGLVAMRFLIGLFESGFSPGCVYLISMYYKRYELQWRLSIFFSASILAGAFGGLFAYAIEHMDGLGGYAGWRWIFIIEGLLTVVVAFISKFLVVDWPETAKFLTDEERALLVKRLAAEVGVAKMDRLDKRAAKRIWADWKIYCCTAMYFGVVNSSYATSFFIPTIIEELGFTATASQIRSIPIFLVAAVAAIGTAYMTDRLQHRYAFTIVGVVIAAIGFIILLCQEHVATGIRYMACFFIVTGGYITQPVTWTWLSNNEGGHYKRAISSAMQIGIGNIGGIVASNIFITSQAPRYPVGYGVSLGLLLLCGIACTVFYFGLKTENRKRDRGERDYRYQEADIDNMGDSHPSFRYTY